MDFTAPSFKNLKIIEPEPPIMPWDVVKISVQVFDEESGARNVTLFYGIGEDPENIEYTGVSMKLVKGNAFNEALNPA
jgi:hypothetical protein